MGFPPYITQGSTGPEGDSSFHQAVSPGPTPPACNPPSTSPSSPAPEPPISGTRGKRLYDPMAPANCERCGWVGSVNAFSHHKMSCGRTKLKCPAPGCTKRFVRNYALVNHFDKSHPYINISDPPRFKRSPPKNPKTQKADIVEVR